MTSSSEPFDDTTKAFYRRFFEQRGMVVETEREVFFRGRAIDIVVNCTNNDRTQLQNTAFSHFQQTNALELKGINDPLTLKDYNRIMMRVWDIGGIDSEKEAEDEDETQQNDNESDADTETESDDADDNQPVRLPNQRTVTIICVRRPNKILNQLKEEMR